MTVSNTPFINFHAHQQIPGDDEIVVHSLFLNEDLIAEPGNKIFFTSGLHPWHADKMKMDEIETKLEKLITEKKIIAVGETGLDKLKGADWQTQLEVFKIHASVAEKYDLPLIIHSVRSHNEILQFRLELKAKAPWVIHLFTGSKQMALDFIRHGFYLSIGHHINSDRSKLSEYLHDLPIEKIFLETDDFDVDIKSLYRSASIKLGVSIEELKKQVWMNFKSLFSRNG